MDLKKINYFSMQHYINCLSKPDRVLYSLQRHITSR